MLLSIPDLTLSKPNLNPPPFTTTTTTTTTRFLPPILPPTLSLPRPSPRGPITCYLSSPRDNPTPSRRLPMPIPPPNRASSILKPYSPNPATRRKQPPQEKHQQHRSHASGAAAQHRMFLLCGAGYWLQGFRCFPWLALNYHLAHGLGLGPSALQLVQNAGNIPMVGKPIYGMLSDALYVRGAHRMPYISFGVLLQVVSWGTLALMPLTMKTFPTQMLCILLGNLGASFAEVVGDALVAEFSKTQKAGVLQSYAYMALAAGGILGNLTGGFFLLKSQQPKILFVAFTLLLFVQLALSLTTRESEFYPGQRSNHKFSWSSVKEDLNDQFSNLVTAISQDQILRPLAWVIASVAIVPLLSGAMFCFQTQHLKLDPSIIGLSKVTGQMFFLCATLFYNRYLKNLPLRTLILAVQALYALSLLSDLILVKQINLLLGISNEAHVLCFSALAESLAQFKILPFTVLLARLCPKGCEGSLFAFFASAMCLSSIVSGIMGVGLAGLIGVSSGNFCNLPLGIFVQSMAALVPLGWIFCVPMLHAPTRAKT